MSNAGDEPTPEFTRAPVYPTTVKIAGIVLFACGALTLLELVLMVMSFLAAVAQSERAHIGIVVPVGLLLGILGAKLIEGGGQLVSGTTALYLLRIGIGSIVLSLLYLFFGVFQARDGFVIPAGINLLVAAGLIGAGVLALVGRHDYKAWHKARDDYKEWQQARDDTKAWQQAQEPRRDAGLRRRL
jgi:hypothetical protein